MKLNLKNLFAVAVVSSLMVGCSSTPKPADSADAEKQKVETNQAEKQNSVDLTANQKKELSAPELLKAVEGKVVYFDYDRSEITNEGFDLIKVHAEYLNKMPKASVKVQGHCDERGSSEYNLALGERRGNAVKNALMSLGIEANRIEVISFGESTPAVNGHDEAAWAKNRRAEFVY